MILPEPQVMNKRIATVTNSSTWVNIAELPTRNGVTLATSPTKHPKVKAKRRRDFSLHGKPKYVSLLTLQKKHRRVRVIYNGVPYEQERGTTLQVEYNTTSSKKRKKSISVKLTNNGEVW